MYRNFAASIVPILVLMVALFLALQMTDATGLYTFPAWPGRYALEVAGQAGYTFSPQDVGDDATDSDVGVDGRSATVVLSSTQTIVFDAGLGIPPTPTPTPTPTSTPTPTATPTQPPSPLPTPPPFSPLPTPTNTPEGYTLPTDRNLLNQCSFTPPPGGIPNEPIIPLSAYSFSAPQEVITHTAPIGIEQWLPDNETLLITRESMENQLVSVDLVNTTTGVVTQIVEPLQYLTEPRWLSLNDTVAWRAIGTLDDMDPGVWEPGYWVRSFDPPWERQLADRGSGASTSHDVSPDGKQLVFMSLPAGTQPLIWNQETQTLDDLPIDLVQRRYQKGLSYPLRPFYPLWHPSGDKILFHDGTWMTLYDLMTNSGCDIDLRTFARRDYYIRDARWSPDGRYLLIKNGSAPLYTTLEGPFDQLLVLDMYTGETVQYSLGNPVTNFSWSPDNQTVVMTEGLAEKIGGFSTDGIFLLNVRSGEHQRILPNYTTLFGVAHMVEWSSDGSKLAVQCMDTLRDLSGGVFDRICVSQVNTSQ